MVYKDGMIVAHSAYIPVHNFPRLPTQTHDLHAMSRVVGFLVKTAGFPVYSNHQKALFATTTDMHIFHRHKPYSLSLCVA